ncbi:unnamed protein product [Phytomonas sp. EM1]|nr:unnamed protein product [Phytomonas sp. EM1]|eukprot:CCW64757.1 unnamed protein product [Phytomonas sp. isolate EM1]
MLNATTTFVGEHPFLAPTTRSRRAAAEGEAFISISPIPHCMCSLPSTLGETELGVLDELTVSQDARERASHTNFLPGIPQCHTTASYYHYYLQHYRDAFFPPTGSRVVGKGPCCNATAGTILDQSEMKYAKRRNIGSTNASVQGLSKSFDNRQCSNSFQDYTFNKGTKSAHLTSEALPSFRMTSTEFGGFHHNSEEVDDAAYIGTSRRLDFSHADSPLPDLREGVAWQSNRGGPLLSDHPQTAPPTYFFRTNDRGTGVELLPKLTPPIPSGIKRLVDFPSYLKPRGPQATHCLSKHERALTDGSQNGGSIVEGSKSSAP